MAAPLKYDYPAPGPAEMNRAQEPIYASPVQDQMQQPPLQPMPVHQAQNIAYGNAMQYPTPQYTTPQYTSPQYTAQVQGDPRLTMRGVPVDQQQGGFYEEERFFGPMSAVVCILGFWCSICIPIDQREVWKSPEGRKIVLATNNF